MRNVDIYHHLAQHSHHALLSLVVSNAHKKDFQALGDFTHTMDQVGATVKTFWAAKEAPSSHSADTDDNDDEVDIPRASFPRALAAAVAPSTHEGGEKKRRLEVMNERVTDDALCFLQQVCGMGTSQISKAFPDSRRRENFLSSVAFNAATLTGDARVFHALFEAGANPTKKFESRHANFVGKQVSIFREALLIGNIEGANAILGHMSPKDAVEAIVGMTEGPRDTALSHATTFHALDEVNYLRYALKVGQFIAVGELLDTICSKAEELGTGGDRGQRVGGIFRTMLAGSYLRGATTQFETDWTEQAIDALRGTTSQLQKDSTIEGHAQRWHDYKASVPGEMWALHDRKATIDKTDYSYATSDLAHQAVRANCAPILKDLQVFLAPAGAMGQAPDIGTAVSRGIREMPALDPVRLKTTVDLLIECGHSVNAPNANYATGGTPMHVLTSLPTPALAVALPVLLALGGDPQALNGKSKTARQLVTDDEAQKTWDNITRSFNARNAAHGILSELEDLGHEPPTTSKPPKP